MELAVGRHQAGFRGERQRREPAHDELVGARAKGDLPTGIAEQRAVALADALGAGEGELPLLVDRPRGVVEGFDDPLARDVRPGLMGMSREQQPLADPEVAIVRGEGVGVGRERRERRSAAHREDRIAQRSGKSGWKRVARRYSTPLDPPVPLFVPIVRSTIFTCR